MEAMKILPTLAAAAFAVTGSCAAHAQDVKQGPLTISGVWARPAGAGQNASAAYLTVKNAGNAADKLVSADCTVAGSTMLHEMTMEGGVMKMRMLMNGADIPAGGMLEFKPGGSHIMLMGLKKTLTEGQTIPVTLTFAKAGTVKVEAKVQKEPAGGAGEMHHH
jgi:periplasmic copper chaperone A